MTFHLALKSCKSLLIQAFYIFKTKKTIDEKLPDDQFEYTGTSDEDLLIGLESGKYDIGTKGVWYTEERTKQFLSRILSDASYSLEYMI